MLPACGCLPGWRGRRRGCSASGSHTHGDACNSPQVEQQQQQHQQAVVADRLAAADRAPARNASSPEGLQQHRVPSPAAAQAATAKPVAMETAAGGAATAAKFGEPE